MDLDPLSIVAPARIKVLLLPVGHVRQSRFESFVQRLQQVNVVRLGDVSPDSRPHRTMFSPLAFPEGLILYDLSTALPPPSHLALSPFEIYRKPLAVVGLADGKNIVSNFGGGEDEGKADTGIGEDTSKMNELRPLVRTLEDLIDDFPKILLHQILVFDHDESPMPERIYPIPAPAKSKTTTIKTVMCDLTSRLLAEMATYAKSLQNLGSLDSPRVSSNATTIDRVISGLPADVNEPSRTSNSQSFPLVGEHMRPELSVPMPGNLPSNLNAGNSTPDSRPTTPSNDIRTTPTSFNEITGSTSAKSPPEASSHARADSRGRAPASGSGVGSLGERERNKGKGRIGITIGAMYLLAGRWPDSVRELVHNAAVARNSSDYLWHAKALDLVLVCLLMYAWAGMDFRIPDNLFPGTEKPGPNTYKSAKYAPVNGLPDPGIMKSRDSVSRLTSLRTLTDLFPDLANTILNLYSRAWTFTDDKLPPLAFSQSAVRFAKLLSAVHLSNGLLDDALLNHLVLNAGIPKRKTLSPEAPPFLSKGEIIDFLFRGYPGSPSETSMTVADQTTIRAGIASVLSELRYHRKKALVLRELMISLLPALVQARKDGAAEMGVHPAASLASLNVNVTALSIENTGIIPDDSEQGMREFLSLITRSYGILPFDLNNGFCVEEKTVQGAKKPQKTSNQTRTQISEAIASRVLWQALTKASGSQDLKIDILRSCINICEALPDFGGALQFSATLLRIGGSCIAPGPESNNGAPSIATDEQLRLINNISRTLSAARQLGFEHPEADYWDEFLVRGIESVNSNTITSLQPHAKSELELINTIDAKQEKNPFIYNPFLKRKTSFGKEPLLVAKEEAWFRVTLQNLYDFDVLAERVKIYSDGVPFECKAQSTTVGPYRMQTMLLSGTPLSSGLLKIYGCSVKIRGCRERYFPIFNEPWSLRLGIKGEPVNAAGKTHPSSTASDSGKNKASRPLQGPTPSMLALRILGTQPNLTMQSISASQASIMLLEGESKSLNITLQNTSRSTPADLLLLAFEDSVASHTQSALYDKELSAIEHYDLEITSAHKQAVQWLHGEKHQDLRIEAGGETSLEIELLGKPGLSQATIQVDYGHLGIPKRDIEGTFYTRQLSIPLTITVNASVKSSCSDICLLPTRFPLEQQPQLDQSVVETENHIQNPPISCTSNVETSSTACDISCIPSLHCALLLDLHNSWSHALTITIEISNASSTPSPTRYTQQIQPGTTQRIPIPFPRLFISNPYAPIPSLNPAHKRQFVVSTTKSSPEAERMMRESFWYREALLARLRARWREESTGRNGVIELRDLKLSPHMLAALKLPELEIGMSARSAEPTFPSPRSSTNAGEVRMTGPSTYTVPISTFLILNTHLHNRSSTPIRPLLRLQPSLANQPHNIALDLNKKLVVNGLLQRVLPALRPGEKMTVETGFLVLSYGIYEWGASVEEVIAVAKGNNKIGRGRAATGDFDVLSDIGRRTWVAECPCIVSARKDEEDMSGMNGSVGIS